MLRASGKNFGVDTFLKKTNLKASAVFRRGEPKSVNNPRKVYLRSGVNIVVSNASFDNIRKQVKDAIRFLEKNKAEIKRLMKFKGIEGAELDFGASKKDQFIQEVEFPSELIVLASSLGLSIKLSQYS